MRVTIKGLLSYWLRYYWNSSMGQGHEKCANMENDYSLYFHLRVVCGRGWILEHGWSSIFASGDAHYSGISINGSLISTYVHLQFCLVELAGMGLAERPV